MSDILTGDAGARDWQTLTDGLRPLGYRQLSQTYIIDGGLHHCPQGNGTPTRAFQAPCRHWTALSLPDMLTTTRRDLHPAFWVSMTGTDNFIQKSDPRKPLRYHITYKFTVNVFFLSLTITSQNVCQPECNVRKRTFPLYLNGTTAESGSFDIAAKRVNKLEI